ncbi:hypothetical protein [Paraburkholderia panacisoli]|nr:hypothetical protein [Paraburkholderia panacisoli]
MQRAKKIIGKNPEEMFGFRKPIEGKNLCGLAAQTQQSRLQTRLIFSTD